MSSSNSYIYPINPNPANGKDSGIENGYIHQSSPSWILTFVRWRYRDTLRIADIAKNQNNPDVNLLHQLKAVEDTLIVRNDCVSVTVSSNKGTYTPTVEMILVQTNIDYLTEVAPGDFVFVNMLNWEKDAEQVAIKADGKKDSINNIQDGFKGFFKVQSVRKSVVITNNETGAKGVVVKITGFAFTEFNNMIYFNQAIALRTTGLLTFAGQISKDWAKILSSDKPFSLRQLIMILTLSFIGSGIPDGDISNPSSSSSQVGVSSSPNNQFYMPAIVGILLGIGAGVTKASDTYNFIFGLQKYGEQNNVSKHSGLNPVGLAQQNDAPRFWFTPDDCPGSSILKPEYWDQVKTWDILNQYANKPINEFFTCFRVAPKSDRIMPTVVFRQIPFTTEDFDTAIQGASSAIKTTKFMNLPRWKINPSMVISEDLGRDEAARINFVQIFGKSLIGANGTDYTAETVKINFVQDLNDIQRSGLRPAVISGLFDQLPEGKGEIYQSPNWAKILGDALIGGHLKFNGTLVCAGIIDPIAVGDNAEYDGIVYHIEQITHKCQINSEDGKKSFRTILSLSSGLSNTSSINGTIYPGMKYGNAYKEREVDYQNSQILPGVSESQDIPVRFDLDQASPFNNPNKSFPQPKEIKVLKDE